MFLAIFKPYTSFRGKRIEKTKYVCQLFRRVIHNELLWQPQLFGTQAKLEVRVFEA